MILLAACITLPARAQDPTPNFPVALDKKLAARATHVNEITLNKNMLAFASQFLSPKQKDDVQAQHLIQKLNGIYVREYDFDQAGQYSADDLQSIRRQFSGPQWSPMVRERSQKGDGDTDVYVQMDKGTIQGMFVLDAQPRELDCIYISGPIRPSDLRQLSGNFGIPNLPAGTGAGSTSGEATK
ncbi:MAG: DUF4252 domain-containing protein [Acidobacteriaceae bacterium]